METTFARKNFQRRLDNALIARHLTQGTVAQHVGLSQSSISDWLSDDPDIKREPTLENFVKTAELLNVRPAWLAFGDDFEPMDDEEREMIDVYRKLADQERADLRRMLSTFAAGRQQQKKLGKRTPKIIIDHDMNIVAAGDATPSLGGVQSASGPDKYHPMLLPPEEYEAVMAWLMPQISTMKKGLPVPKALRKIATRLADDNEPAASAKKQDQSATEKDTSGTTAPTAAAPRRRHALPAKGRHS